MKYQVGQFLLSLNSFGYNYQTGLYNCPVIMEVVEVRSYVIMALRLNTEFPIELRKANLLERYKLLSPVEMALYE